MGFKTTAHQRSANRIEQSTARTASSTTRVRQPGDHLQRTIGNSATSRLLTTNHIQTKLTVSHPEDESEREADRVADEVMRMPDSQSGVAVQRSPLKILRVCDECEEELQRKFYPDAHSNLAQEEDGVRRHPREEEALLQAKRSPSGAEQTHRVPAAMAANIHALEGGGSPLPQATRSFFEPRFGADFSQVRVHTDSRATEATHSVKAKAFTVGRNIAFGPAEYSPQTQTGRQLLAHELTHVLQQRPGLSGKPIQRNSFEHLQRDSFDHLQINSIDHLQRNSFDHLQRDSFEHLQRDSFEHLQRDSLEPIQRDPIDHLQRVDDDDASDQQPDQASKTPQELLADVMDDFEIDPDDEEITSKEKANKRRILLLIEAEINRLDNEPGYLERVYEQDPTLDNYEGDTISNILAIADSEDQTIDKLIADRRLSASRAQFAWNPFFAQNVAAFPDSFLKIANELLDPPYDEGNRLIEDTNRGEANLNGIHEQMPKYFFQDGLPVGRQLSLTLTQYELINKATLRMNYLQLLKRKPSYESDLDFAVNLEKKDPPTGLMAQYQSAWIGRAINLYGTTLFGKWAGQFLNVKNSIEDGNIGSIDPVGLRAFQGTYPDGLTSLDDLVRYSGSVATGGGDINPYNYYSLLRIFAVADAAQKTADFITTEHGNFNYELSTADAQVRNLTDTERLTKALYWSVQKGFAADGIMAVVDNFGNMLEDILKEKAKRSIFRRIVSFAASLHPLGRLAVLAYNVYETVQDVKDAMDIFSLIRQTVAAIDNARSAGSVIGVQRAAAELSYVYEQVIPLIAQKISAGLAKKLMKGSDKKRGAADDEEATAPVTKPTHQDRKRILEETKDIKTVDKLIGEPKYLLGELDAAHAIHVKKSTHPDYEVEVTLPNKHTWRRNSKGVWCRFSDESCILSAKDLPDEMRRQLEDLDADAEKYKQAEGTEYQLSQAEMDDLSKTKSNNPPGSKKPIAKTTLGTFMHSKDYTKFVNWLDTPPGLKWLANNSLTHADLALRNLPTGNIGREFEYETIGGKRRIDVVDWDNATVHEIKPAGKESLGFVEAQGYAEDMNKLNPRPDGKPWVAGRTITYDGQKILDVFIQFGYFEK